MIKNRPSEVIPRLKKTNKTTFAYVNTQPRLQIFPNRRSKSIKKKNNNHLKTGKAGVCKFTIKYRLGFWTSGETQSQSSEEE